MTLAEFPSWINQGVLQDGYGEEPETNVAAFKPDIGRPKLRRRTSISQDILPCRMWLGSSDWEDLKAFHRFTLLDGTQQFTWVHPRNGVAATFVFEGNAPTITATNGPIFEVSFSLRLVSGGVVLPTVLSISPPNGATAGGTAVTITGTNFNGATGVTIGGAAAPGVTVVNATTITATTPAGTGGVADVDVTTARGTGIGSALFTYNVWYAAYAVGSTNPYGFADTTTEGTTNHYLWNGTTYSSFAAWLTAASGTFARSSAAYYINSSGVLTSASSGVLRFDYDPLTLLPKGILREGASTNILLQSGFASTWLGYSASLTANNAAGPDGNATSAALISSSSTSSPEAYQFPFSISGGATYSFSAWLKAGTCTAAQLLFTSFSSGAYITAFFDLSGGTVGQTAAAGSGAAITSTKMVAYPNGWYRCSLTGTLPSAVTSAGVAIGLAAAATGNSLAADGENNSGAASGKTVYGFGPQLENSSVASSYIPTTSSTASRAADSLYIPWTATTFTARIKATLAGEVDGNYLADTGHGLLTEASGPNAQTSNGTQTLATGITAFTSSNIIVVGGSASGRVLSANGNAAASDSNALVPSAGTEFYIGQSAAGGNQANGNYAQFGLWTVAPTAAQAATLSGTA